MPLFESLNNFLPERLKFPFYSRREADLGTTQQTSVTATKPEHIETAYAAYDPFASTVGTGYGPLTVFASNKNELIRRWREASYLPEVDIAISEISNEAIVFDEVDDAITLNLNDVDIPEPIKEKMQESFNKILYLLDFNEQGDQLFHQWYVDSELNIEVIYDNDNIRDGIQKLQLLSPFNFNTFIDPVTGQKKYAYTEMNSNANRLKTQDQQYIFYDEQITHINSGKPSMDRKCYVSYLNKAMKAINQLSLIEDALVIYRITRSPEKRAFYINTGSLNKSKAEEYMRSMIQKYRQKKVYNTETGTIEDKSKSVSILEDIWFAMDKNGASSKVEPIAGAAPNFGGFEDVDYFVNKVYKSLGIPENRRNKDGRLTEGNNIDIEKDELKFFKHILKLRRRFNNLFVDLLKKDLIAQNVLSLEDWNIIQEKVKFTYANSNEYTEIKNNQILSMRMDAANTATGLVDAKYLSVEYVQEKILRLSDEEITKINQQNAMRAAEEAGMGGEEDFGMNDFPDHEVRRRIQPSRGGMGTGGAPKPPVGDSGAPESGSGPPLTPPPKGSTQPPSPIG